MNEMIISTQIEGLRTQSHLIATWLEQTGGIEIKSVPVDGVEKAALADTFASAVEEVRAAEEELRRQCEVLLNVQSVLEQERNRYQELFDFAPDAYFLTDANGVIREANHAVSSLVGFARRYVINKPLSAFVASGDQHDFQTRLLRMQTSGVTGVQEWEQRLRPRRRDHELVAAVRVGPIRDRQGRLIGLRWMLRDITERNQLENDLHRLTAELERRVRERTAQLEAANKVNSAWLAQEQSAALATEQRYQRLFLRARDGLFRAAPDGRLRQANPALARLLGYESVEALILASNGDEPPMIDPVNRASLLQRVLDQETLEDVEVLLTGRDGAERHVLISAWIVRDDRGAVVAIEGTVGAAVPALLATGD
jgi:PAS domain S-box-containing protein